MNTQLLTARDSSSRASTYQATPAERLARRAGLALVRWSSRGTLRARLSRERLQSRRSADVLRQRSRLDNESLVLLNRPF